MRRLMLVGAVVIVAVSAVVVSGASSAGSVQSRWVIRDLGTLGGPYSEAHVITERAQVVGESTTGATEGASGKLVWRTFLWEQGRIRRLPGGKVIVGNRLLAKSRVTGLRCSPGYPQIDVNAVNAGGDVVGGCWATPNGPSRAVLWRGGRVIDLGLPRKRGAATMATATAINDRGQVVGYSFSRSGPYERAFLWEDGKVTDLGAWEPVAINNRGHVIGYSEIGISDGMGRSFLWHNGKTTDLGRQTQVVAINERGQVIAATAPADHPGATLWEGGTHALLWQAGKRTDLGTLGGPDAWSSPVAINDQGQIVVNSYTARKAPSGRDNPRAFVWQDGTVTRLVGLAGNEPTRISGAASINNLGQIAGWSNTGKPSPGTGQDPPFHAVLWTLRSG